MIWKRSEAPYIQTTVWHTTPCCAFCHDCLTPIFPSPCCSSPPLAPEFRWTELLRLFSHPILLFHWQHSLVFLFLCFICDPDFSTITRSPWTLKFLIFVHLKFQFFKSLHIISYLQMLKSSELHLGLMHAMITHLKWILMNKSRIILHIPDSKTAGPAVSHNEIRLLTHRKPFQQTAARAACGVGV